MLLTTLPLSQTVTPSPGPSPSSVTYFMDGPDDKYIFSKIVPKSILCSSCLKYRDKMGLYEISEKR